MTFYSWQENELLLKIYVQPNASKDEIVGEHQGELKIRLTSLPTEGQANQRLCKLLSKWFAVKKDQVTIKYGLTNRHKLVVIKEPKKLIAGVSK